MGTNTRHCRAALLAVLFLAPFQPSLSHDRPTATESATDVLARPFPGNGSSYGSTSEAFQSVMLQSGVPGGDVIIEGCGGGTNKVVRVLGTTLGKALESIEAADPRYRWELEDGVVVLMPAEGVPPLLKVRVRGFNSMDSSDVSSAGMLLFALPDVRDALGKLGLTRNASGSGLYAVSPGLHRQAPPLDIDLHDITVRDALNAIVRTNGSGIWIYREILCGTSKLFDIGFSH